MLADTSNYDLQNVECQSLIPSCKISSKSPRFAMRTIMNLNDVLNRRLCPQQPVPACGLTHGCVTMLSDSQGCELFHFVLIPQLRHNGRESVHVTVHAFSAATNQEYVVLVTTSDLMFRKSFDLWWLDKLHVEMDLMWLWR